MRGPGVLYVGNLPDGVREGDIADAFDKVRSGAASEWRAEPTWSDAFKRAAAFV